MLTLGIDCGSTTTKGVLLDGNDIVETAILPTSARPRERMAELYARLYRPGVQSTVATGYGRAPLPQADRQVTEITCPAPGAEPAGEFYARVQGFLRALGRGPGAVLLVAHGGVSIPVQMFARGLQSLGPGGQYVPLILPHGRVLPFTVPQQKGQNA